MLFDIEGNINLASLETHRLRREFYVLVSALLTHQIIASNYKDSERLSAQSSPADFKTTLRYGYRPPDLYGITQFGNLFISSDEIHRLKRGVFQEVTKPGSFLLPAVRQQLHETVLDKSHCAFKYLAGWENAHTELIHLPRFVNSVDILANGRLALYSSKLNPLEAIKAVGIATVFKSIICKGCPLNDPSTCISQPGLVKVRSETRNNCLPAILHQK